MNRPGLVVVFCVACRSNEAPRPAPLVHGDYALGPVEFHGAEHNACGPHLPATERVYGADLVGIGSSYSGHAELCDACVEITTRVGTRVVARVVTYGETRTPGSIDLSSHAFATLLRPDPSAPPESPRPMSWHVVPCPDAPPIAIQFQSQANVDWSAFWVRNPKWPLAKVEVRSSRHASFTMLRRETDGTFVDDGGFGPGAFTLRLHASSGGTIDARFETISPGGLIDTRQNFD